MTDVLVDTSVWIEFLAGRGPAEMRDALAERRVLMCGVVATELLSGARGEVFETLRSRLLGLRWAGIAESEDWVRAGRLRADALGDGRPIAMADALLAALALRHSVPLWTSDRDFEAVAGREPSLNVRLF